MAISAPRLKRLMPRMRKRADNPKTVSSRGVISTHGVMARRNTSSVTGKTETRDSFSLSRRAIRNSFKMEVFSFIVQK